MLGAAKKALSVTASAAVNYETVTLAVDHHHWVSPGSLQLNSLGKENVPFVGRGHAPAAHVSLPLHPPTSTAPKPSPSGEGGPAKPGRMRGAALDVVHGEKSPLRHSQRCAISLGRNGKFVKFKRKLAQNHLLGGYLFDKASIEEYNGIRIGLVAAGPCPG